MIVCPWHVSLHSHSAVGEIVPEVGDNRFNMCYRILAHGLGLRYHAVRAPNFDSSGVATVPLVALEALPLWGAQR